MNEAVGGFSGLWRLLKHPFDINTDLNDYLCEQVSNSANYTEKSNLSHLRSIFATLLNKKISRYSSVEGLLVQTNKLFSLQKKNAFFISCPLLLILLDIFFPCAFATLKLSGIKLLDIELNIGIEAQMMTSLTEGSHP